MGLKTQIRVPRPALADRADKASRTLRSAKVNALGGKSDGLSSIPNTALEDRTQSTDRSDSRNGPIYTCVPGTPHLGREGGCFYGKQGWSNWLCPRNHNPSHSRCAKCLARNHRLDGKKVRRSSLWQTVSAGTWGAKISQTGARKHCLQTKGGHVGTD